MNSEILKIMRLSIITDQDKTNILSYLRLHPEYINSFESAYFFDGGEFSHAHENAFKALKQYYADFNEVPSFEQSFAYIQKFSPEESKEVQRAIWADLPGIKNEEQWRRTVINFGRLQTYLCNTIGSLEYVSQILNGNNDHIDISELPVDKIIAKANEKCQAAFVFTAGQHKGHDFFDAETHQIPAGFTHSTGYPFIDKCLNGGFSKKALYVWMGAPKSGKSLWLCNLAAESMKQGHNCIYITLELDYHTVTQRIGSNLLNVPMEEYDKLSKDTPALNAKLAEFKKGRFLKKLGEFHIEEFPTSTATASDIESFVISKEREMQANQPGFKYDNVFIDYINIMKDQKGANSENTYVKIKNICEDIRAVGQRNEWAIISVTQTNKAAMDSSDMSMGNVSESVGLIATVDALFGIISTPQLRAENFYYLKAIALRNSPLTDMKQRFIANKPYMRISQDMTVDPIDASEESMYGAPKRSTNNVFKPSHQNSQQTQAQQEQPAQTAQTQYNTNKLDLNLTNNSFTTVENLLP